MQILLFILIVTVFLGPLLIQCEMHAQKSLPNINNDETSFNLLGNSKEFKEFTGVGNAKKEELRSITLSHVTIDPVVFVNSLKDYIHLESISLLNIRMSSNEFITNNKRVYLPNLKNYTIDFFDHDVIQLNNFENVKSLIYFDKGSSEWWKDNQIHRLGSNVKILSRGLTAFEINVDRKKIRMGTWRVDVSKLFMDQVIRGCCVEGDFDLNWLVIQSTDSPSFVPNTIEFLNIEPEGWSSENIENILKMTPRLFSLALNLFGQSQSQTRIDISVLPTQTLVYLSVSNALLTQSRTGIQFDNIDMLSMNWCEVDDSFVNNFVHDFKNLRTILINGPPIKILNTGEEPEKVGWFNRLLKKVFSMEVQDVWIMGGLGSIEGMKEDSNIYSELYEAVLKDEGVQPNATEFRITKPDTRWTSKELDFESVYEYENDTIHEVKVVSAAFKLRNCISIISIEILLILSSTYLTRA